MFLERPICEWITFFSFLSPDTRRIQHVKHWRRS